jgi:ribosomal protein S18 acetylase RimI-like enzyme
MQLPQVQIESLSRYDVAEAAELLGKSFATNPVSIWLFGEASKDMCKRLVAVFELMLEIMPSQSCCIKENGRIASVMRTVPPGLCKPSSGQALRAIPRLLGAAGTKSLRVLEYLSFLNKLDPKERHWHLSLLAVDPNLQRRGLGSRMVRHLCNQVDLEGERICLETNEINNVRFYERHGFKTICEASLHNVPFWYMWRTSPRSSAQPTEVFK